MINNSRFFLTLIFFVYLNNLKVNTVYAASLIDFCEQTHDEIWVKRIYKVTGDPQKIAKVVEDIKNGKTPFIKADYNETQAELTLYCSERLDLNYINGFLDKISSSSLLIGEERNTKKEFLSPRDVQLKSSEPIQIKQEDFDRFPIAKQQRILANPELFVIKK